MATQNFAATIEDWALRVKGAPMAILRESAQELVSQMQELLTQMVYQQPLPPSGRNRTGFLRASLVGSKTDLPSAIRPNPGGTYPDDISDIVLMINGLEPDETLYLGYTANYAPYVHYGANGRPPRPWVDLAVQRWTMIVEDKARELKQRLKI